jgi:ElaB/YqjD/DUF883 family membrane-anchored ribosome-binding protein
MSVGYENGGENQRAKARQGGNAADWDTLKDDVGEIAGAAVERGRHFLDSAREQATHYVDRRKDDVAQSVADFATSLRESTTSFEDRPNIRAFVDSAAEGLDQLADTIRQRSFADIFNEAEDIVRQRPAAVAAVTVAIGFLAARFIKSSSEGLRRDHAYQGGRHQGGRYGNEGSYGARARQGSPAPQRGPQGSQSGADI